MCYVPIWRNEARHLKNIWGCWQMRFLIKVENIFCHKGWSVWKYDWKFVGWYEVFLKAEKLKDILSASPDLGSVLWVIVDYLVSAFLSFMDARVKLQWGLHGWGKAEYLTISKRKKKAKLGWCFSKFISLSQFIFHMVVQMGNLRVMEILVGLPGLHSSSYY